MATPDDKALVAAVLAGERAAFEKLYDRYAPLVRAICHDATRNLPDAQDLAQDVFVRAYEKLEHLRNPNRFGKWLVGIARLRCREWWRESSKHKEDRAEPGPSQSATSDASDDDRIARLRKAVTLLPEKERLALHAFYLQGKSADNARAVMGLSRSGFYRLLERARKRLEQSLLQQ